jgi:hypothetical protein
MKKIIITAVVIVTFCFTLGAQNSVQVNASITTSFGDEFNDASNVSWEKISDEIFLVRFDRQQENSIAYFDKTGKLLVSGRKITFEQAPRLVQHGLDNIIKSYEKKNGMLSVSHVYELIEEGETRYYTSIGNTGLLLAVMSTSDGGSKIIKKVNSDFRQQNTPIVAFIK